MSLLKRPNTLNSSFARECDQSLNRSGFKSALNRSGTKSPLNRSDYLASKWASSVSNLRLAGPTGSLLSLDALRRKSDSPGRQALTSRSQRLSKMRNNMIRTSSSDGFSFKKRISDSVAERLDRENDLGKVSPRSFDGKIFRSTRTSDAWGLQSTNPNSLRQSRSTLIKNSNSFLNTSPPKSVFQSTQLGRIGADLETSIYRDQISPVRGNTSSRLLDQSTTQTKMLPGYKSKILGIDTSPRHQSPLSTRRHTLITNPLLSAEKSIQASPGQSNQKRQFLSSFVTDGISGYRASYSLSSSHVPQYLPYSFGGRDSIKGVASFNDDLRRIRFDMHANINDRTYVPTTKFTKLTERVHSNKPEEDIIDRLFDISPEKLKHNILRSGCQKRVFGKAASTARIHELQDLLTDAPDRDFDSLSNNHLEEMLKLSSIIVSKVKASTYYYARS